MPGDECARDAERAPLQHIGAAAIAGCTAVASGPVGSPQLLLHRPPAFTAVPLPTIAPFQRYRFADFGAGPLPDLVVTAGPEMRIFRQPGFVDVTASIVPTGFTGIAMPGDFDNDGDIDLIGASLLENDGVGNFALRAGGPTIALSGFADARPSPARAIPRGRSRPGRHPSPRSTGSPSALRSAAHASNRTRQASTQKVRSRHA